MKALARVNNNKPATVTATTTTKRNAIARATPAVPQLGSITASNAAAMKSKLMAAAGRLYAATGSGRNAAGDAAFAFEEAALSIMDRDYQAANAQIRKGMDALAKHKGRVELMDPVAPDDDEESDEV